MVEKRRYSRWALADKKAKVHHKSAAASDVPLLDLSSGGMKIVLPEELPVGSVIKGEFNVMPQQGAYYIQGEVVWSKPLPESKAYEVGVKFSKIKTAPIA